MHMKKIITFILVLSVGIQYSTAQENSSISMFTKAPIPEGAKAFNVKGKFARTILNKLTQLQPKHKERRYVHTFKRVKVAGIKEELTLKIHEGVHGRTARHSYFFNTFRNKKDKNSRLSHLKETDQPGIIIYIKKENGEVLTQQEEARNFRAFLEQLGQE